jgi:glycogen phosphorylase
MSRRWRCHESGRSDERRQPTPRHNPLDRFNCGPAAFSGDRDPLYERHLTFYQVVPVAAVTPRVKFEAIARSVRDLLSQRWIKAEQTYQTRNVKRVYYLSLEFLIPVARIPDRPLAINCL